MNPPNTVPYCSLKEMAPTIAAMQRCGEALAQSPRRVLDMAKLGVEIRRQMVENLLFDWFGDVVQSGPFAGMRLSRANQGSLPGPRLLGCYEQELHEIIRDGVGQYRRILNVGCAEGWYAVGLARLYPHLEIVAYDIDAQARSACAKLAELNDVAGRIDIRAAFDAAQLAELAESGVLVLMDIEGAEADLLPTLRRKDVDCCDWLIEIHEVATTSTLDVVTHELGSSHDLRIFPQTPRNFTEHPLLEKLSQLDRFLAQWEGRGSEPWVMAVAREHRA